MTTESPSQSHSPDERSDDAGDTKAQFRAALERKRAQKHAGAAGISGDAKTRQSQAGAGGQRMFRRKSG